MDNTLKIQQSIEISAPATDVWKALVDPALIKKYFFGTDIETSWEKGAPVIWRGEWDGKTYEEKGEVLDIDEGVSLSMSYLASGQEDKSENYSVVNWSLDLDDPDFTTLTVSQIGFRDQEACDHSAENWKAVLESLRKVVEEENAETNW